MAPATRPARLGYGLKQAGVRMVVAIAPAVTLLLPVMLHNHRTHGDFMPTRNTGLLLYHRAGCVDGLDSDTSEAVARIRTAVERAKERELLAPGATHHNYLAAVLACQHMYDMDSPIFASSSLGEVTKLMSRAGRDLMLEHPWPIIRGTVLDSYRICVMPDRGYRMQPGAPSNRNRLTPGATLYAADTYAPAVTERVDWERLDHYLPVSNEPTRTTPLWSKITKWYHHRIEKGSPVVGLLDTPYEEFAAIWMLGAVLSLGLRQRFCWLLLGFVVFYHIVGAAFYGGAQPRYAVPVHPFMHILAALPVVLLARAAATGLAALPFRASACLGACVRRR